MPAAGPHLPLRPRQHPHALPEADDGEADPDLAADRTRPGALHPLLSLHAVQRGRCRGRAARRDQPRRLVGDRDLRGRAVQGTFLGQRHRALPGRCTHLDAVPLRSAAVGDPERPDRLRALPGRLQHHGYDARGEGQARPLAQPPRGRRRLALRQGPLRLRAPERARPHHDAASPRRPAPVRGARAGTKRSTSSKGCCAKAVRRP